MKKIGFIGFGVAAAVLMAGCSDSRVTMPSDDVIIHEKATASIHPKEKYFLGQVEVKLGDRKYLAPVVENMKAKGIDVSLLDKVPTQPLFLLKVNSNQSINEVMKALKSDDKVISVSKNYLVTTEALRVNDPLSKTQWALENYGQEAPRALAGRVGSDIGMAGVTATGSHEVVVAVIDTGIDYFHEDLAITEMVNGKKKVMPGSNIWVNPEEIPDNNINDDNNADSEYGISYVDDVHGYNFVSRNGDPMDDQGHGTHVSGVIGALRNNFKGIAGINQKVSLMALKFLSAEGGGSDWDAQLAIYYAVAMKQKYPQKKFILQNSWGASGRESKNGDEDDHLLEAFAVAANNDILIAAAAGNDNVSNRFSENYPSNYSTKIPNFLAVAATNNLDQRASFSSYGFENVQVAAPGVLIQSTVPAALYEGGYAAWSGTSMATPHVSGMAALVWSENMNMTATEVRQRIMDTVDVVPELSGIVETSGRINIRRALAGDVNVKTQPVLEEVPYVISSPRPSGSVSFDLMTKVEHKGAKQLAVCFSKINLGGSGDWIEILDASYRVKDTIQGFRKAKNWKGEYREMCSAPVNGESLYIRLAASADPTNLRGYETKSLKVLAK